VKPNAQRNYSILARDRRTKLQPARPPKLYSTDPFLLLLLLPIAHSTNTNQEIYQIPLPKICEINEKIRELLGRRILIVYTAILSSILILMLANQREEELERNIETIVHSSTSSSIRKTASKCILENTVKNCAIIVMKTDQ